MQDDEDKKIQSFNGAARVARCTRLGRDVELQARLLHLSQLRKADPNSSQHELASARRYLRDYDKRLAPEDLWQRALDETLCNRRGRNGK